MPPTTTPTGRKREDTAVSNIKLLLKKTNKKNTYTHHLIKVRYLDIQVLLKEDKLHVIREILRKVLVFFLTPSM